MSVDRTLKDVARHVLHKVGYKRRFSYLVGSRAENFTAIYNQKIWTRNAAQSPLSGPGSSLEATQALRKSLPAMLDRLDTKTLLDLGCGDFTWMQHVELTCDYIGVDIVASVIERNQAEFGSPTRTFQVADFVNSVPPRADVVLCREVLFHLGLDDIVSGLRNIVASGCSFVIMTTDANAVFNADIESGDFRPINLERRPFRLPPPDHRLDDSGVYGNRYMGVWTAEAVRKALA